MFRMLNTNLTSSTTSITDNNGLFDDALIYIDMRE